MPEMTSTHRTTPVASRLRKSWRLQLARRTVAPRAQARRWASSNVFTPPMSTKDVAARLITTVVLWVASTRSSSRQTASRGAVHRSNSPRRHRTVCSGSSRCKWSSSRRGRPDDGSGQENESLAMACPPGPASGTLEYEREGRNTSVNPTTANRPRPMVLRAEASTRAHCRTQASPLQRRILR